MRKGDFFPRGRAEVHAACGLLHPSTSLQRWPPTSVPPLRSPPHIYCKILLARVPDPSNMATVSRRGEKPASLTRALP